MNRKAAQLFAYYLTVGVIVTLILGLAACSSKAPATSIAPTAKITSIAVTPDPPPDIPVHSNLQFTATATYADGSIADVTNMASFMGFNNTVLTITERGLAYGVSVGSVKINATLSGVTSPPVVVTVVSP